MTFTGFPEEALDFYEGLEADNSKAYWADHKATYESAVRAPMQALLDATGAEFGEGSIFRPYRDVRFAKDKTPYKTHIGAFTGDKSDPGFYVQLSAAGLVAAGGLHGPTGDQVARMRDAVADNRSGEALERIIRGLRRKGCDIGGEALKTAPRGFDRDHPRVELLRYRGIWGWYEWKPEPWLHGSTAKDRVVKAWRELGPLVDWLHTYVGSPRS